MNRCALFGCGASAGMADTVVDASLENLDDARATGFVFDQFDAAGIDAAVRRAFALYKRTSEWEDVQAYAMQQQFGWDAAAAQYLALYQQTAPTHSP